MRENDGSIIESTSKLSFSNGSDQLDKSSSSDGIAIARNSFRTEGQLNISSNNNNNNNNIVNSKSHNLSSGPSSPFGESSSSLSSSPLKSSNNSFAGGTTSHQQVSTPPSSSSQKNDEGRQQHIHDSSSSTIKTGLSSSSSLSSPSTPNLSSLSTSLNSPVSSSTPKKSQEQGAHFLDSSDPREDKGESINNLISGNNSSRSASYRQGDNNSHPSDMLPRVIVSSESLPISKNSDLASVSNNSSNNHQLPYGRVTENLDNHLFPGGGGGGARKPPALPPRQRQSASLNTNELSTLDVGVSGAGGGANITYSNDNSSVSASHYHNPANHQHHHHHSHSSSNISSTEDNFECVGEGPESLLESHSEHSSLQFSRDVPLMVGEGGGPPSISRNTWLRTSLRKSPQQQQASPNGDGMGHRRWGSFRHSSGTKRHAVTSTSALANHLYRSSSFHSSGRSSTGDPEEMYSDGSLEDEVIDLTQKVHHLEEKFSVLAENQTDVDDRYIRIKQENTELSTKLFMAEETLKDVEQRAHEKLKDEQKRFKEVLARVEREKQLQVEIHEVRLNSCEKDLRQAKQESTGLKQSLEKERSEKSSISDKLYETVRELSNVRDDNRDLMEALRKERDSYLLDSKNAQQALQELRKEFELRMKVPNGNSYSQHAAPIMRYNSTESESEAAELKSRLNELEKENKLLKLQNTQLQESNDELNAQILNLGLEEGRHLLIGGDVGNSLAVEFEEMSQDQLKTALKEQKEVNDQLRTYIDGILLNIVENYPQLLEVKNKFGQENSME